MYTRIHSHSLLVCLMHVSTEKKISWSIPQENTNVGRSHTHIKYEAEDWYKTAINSHKARSASLKVT